jgi:cytochrome d ubiquinol oxidase subunit I
LDYGYSFGGSGGAQKPLRRWRRGPPSSKWFLRAAVIAGPGAVVAMECGWITTEVGRQPWIVYKVMRTADAVNPAPGLYWGLVALIVVYSILTVVTLLVLRHLAVSGRASAEA